MPSATTPLAPAGKAAEGEPRVRRPAGRPPYRTPRGRRIRGSAPHSVLVFPSLVCLRRQPRRRSRCVSKARRRRSSARPSRPSPRLERAGCARAGVAARRALLPRDATSFGPYVDQVGRYGGSASSGWVFKVNDVSPPVGADKVQLNDGDPVLWYYADFGPTGGPPTLTVKAGAGKGCYTAHALDDDGKARDRQRSRRCTSARRRPRQGDDRHAMSAPARTPAARARDGDRARSARTP